MFVSLDFCYYFSQLCVKIGGFRLFDLSGEKKDTNFFTTFVPNIST